MSNSSSNKKNLSGVWMLLHRMCLNGKGDDYIKILGFIDLLVKNTGCKECNKHSSAYLETVKPSPETAYKTKGYDGLFEWTVTFHNTVNARLQKPQYTIEDAKKLYIGDCFDCVVEEEKQKPKDEDDPAGFIRSHMGRKHIIFH